MNNQKKAQKIYLNVKTAYLTGVIIGDGNLSNSPKSHKTDLSKDYRISIDLSDKKFLLYIYKIIKTIIKTRTKPKSIIQKGDRTPRLRIYIRNKALYNFLNKTMEVPEGSKSSAVIIPSLIRHNSSKIKRYFIAGYFDTDGGFRGNSLGFTTASKQLQIGLSSLLNELDVSHGTEIWFNKKYGREFYGIRLRRKEIDNFLNSFPLQNKEKLKRINSRFKCGDAGVAKRDRFSGVNVQA
ncbi:LAGLIDADG family homing endonuclease [Candidatus Woesearchaeota archaeon]|nr:LAGLIDADG family homing endonuclease [Candidatus Woesearchaeota archaeon]